jgi:hypothetical protein
VKGCVLAFNAQDGNPDVGGNQPGLLLFTRLGVASPAPNCARSAWGNPTNGNTSILLQGALKGASGDFGTQLDVNHIPQGVPLSDFQTTVQKGSYVSARCNDANKQWNLRAKFTYTPSGTQTVTDSQPCQVKQGPPPPPPAPNTQITKAKIDKKRKQAKFTFKATGTSTGFECKLRGKGQKGGFKSCDSPKKYKRLKKGKYTFQVRAVGPGGKDATPAKKTFKIKKKRHHKHHHHHKRHHRH